MNTLNLSDITLRIADQSQDIVLSFREKIEVAKLMDRLDLSVIELPPIRNRKADILLVKSIASAVRHSTVAVPVSLDPQSVSQAWAAVKDAVSPRLQLIVATSPGQMEYFYHRKPDKMAEDVASILRMCRELCDNVELVADDACRSEKGFLFDLIRRAADAGASVITICDSAGVMLPDELTTFLDEVCHAVPEGSQTRLGILCTDTLGLAASCTVSAIRSGIREVKTVSGLAGYTRLIDIDAILQNRCDVLRSATGIRSTEIRRTTSQIARLLHNGAALPEDRMPSEFSDENSGAILSKHDDPAAVRRAAEAIGYDLSAEDLSRVCDAVRIATEKKESISARELDSIIASEALQVPPTYRLDNFSVTCGHSISASAHLRIQFHDRIIEGVCLGDGPIDAAFRSIEQIIGRHFELDDFQIQSVTEGHEAMGETLVRLRSDGKLYSGRGISTDIVGSSIHAYLNALNKIAYEEGEE